MIPRHPTTFQKVAKIQARGLIANGVMQAQRTLPTLPDSLYLTRLSLILAMTVRSFQVQCRKYVHSGYHPAMVVPIFTREKLRYTSFVGVEALRLVAAHFPARR